jgi:8-oxo-dGTP pyrophosphatase MutT (NUDIX family)
MIKFSIIARGLYRPEQLVIHYDPALRMPITAEMRIWMDELWEKWLTQARANGTRLFEAPLFRYIGAVSNADGTLSLTLGDTTYKEYVTTRIPEFAEGRSRQDLGNALSVCSVVETSDGYILLDRRQGVDVYAGRYHVIGGFFERGLDSDGAAQPDPFAAMRREIREETGIQVGDIREQYSLGVVYDLETPHAEMCFLTRLGITVAEVLTREPEEDEIKQLRTLQVSADSLREFIVSNHGNISSTGEPNLLMYGGWKFGEAWFEEVMGSL